MYNGIGLATARGSGTNGYVQRNWATVRKTKEKVSYRTEQELEALDASNNRQPNQEILDHERKRKIEVKCAELEEVLEEQGYSRSEVTAKVAAFRGLLQESGDTTKKMDLPRDELGRVVVRETHQIAEAQQEKNAKLREAFGISEYFVEGSSLDPNRRAKEAAAAQQAASALQVATQPNKKYGLVRTPSPEPTSLQPDEDKSKKRKRKARDSSSSPERKKEKSKKSKKHKRDRSGEKARKDKKSASKEKRKSRRKARSSSSSSSDSEPPESDSSSDSDGSIKAKKRRKKEKGKHGSNKKSRDKDSKDKERKHSDASAVKKKKKKKKRKASPSDSSSDSSPERPTVKKHKDKVLSSVAVHHHKSHPIPAEVEHRRRSGSDDGRHARKQAETRRASPPKQLDEFDEFDIERPKDADKQRREERKRSPTNRDHRHVDEDLRSRRASRRGSDNESEFQKHRGGGARRQSPYQRADRSTSRNRERDHGNRRRSPDKEFKKRDHRGRVEDRNVHKSHTRESEIHQTDEKNGQRPNSSDSENDSHRRRSKERFEVQGRIAEPSRKNRRSPSSDDARNGKDNKQESNKSDRDKSPPKERPMWRPLREQQNSKQSRKRSESLSDGESPNKHRKKRTKSPDRNKSSNVTRDRDSQDKIQNPEKQTHLSDKLEAKQRSRSPSPKSKKSKKQRDNSSGSSSLSYSPVDRHPERYQDILFPSSNDKSNKKDQSSKSRSKSHTDRSSPRSQNIPKPQVRLRSPMGGEEVTQEQDSESELEQRAPSPPLPLPTFIKHRFEEKIITKETEVKTVVSSVTAAALQTQVAALPPVSHTVENKSQNVASSQGQYKGSELLGLKEVKSPHREITITRKKSRSSSRSSRSSSRGSRRRSSSSSSRSSSSRSSSRSRRGRSSSSSGSDKRARRRGVNSRSRSLSSSSGSSSGSSRTGSRHSSHRSSRSRSPSIPRRRGSPSFLDRRRITSARKRPIPYHRPTPPTQSSASSDSEASSIGASSNGRVSSFSGRSSSSHHSPYLLSSH